jgi:hypothetical protein
MSHFRGPRPRCDEAPCDVDDVADVSAHASGRSARQSPVLNLGSLPAKDAESWLARSSIDAEREPSLASRASTRPDSVAPLRELAVDLREQFPPQPTQCGHCYTWFPTRNALFRHLEWCKQKKPKWKAAQPKPREGGSEVGDACAPSAPTPGNSDGARPADGDALSPSLNLEHSPPLSLASSHGVQACPRPPPSNLDKYSQGLPNGWAVKWSTKKGRPYYFRLSEPKKPIWKRPIGEPVGPEPAV